MENTERGAGETGQWLRALPALAEGLGSAACTPTAAHDQLYLQLQGLWSPLLTPPAPGMHMVQKPTSGKTSTHKIKISKSIGVCVDLEN